jgi:predicted Zn-dependent protease
MSMRIILGALGLLLVCVVGCETLDAVTEVGTSIGVATGSINEQQAESIKRSSKAVGKTFEDITPEQEYYIGRAVAATILSTYKPYDDEELTAYINLLGQTLAMASDKPETFGGYHFLVLDSDEINAFAAPGGFILVSRGMLRCCKDEDALAGVLAHEVGHVANNHGLKAIKKGRLTSALTILALESAKSLGGDDLAEVTKAFEGSISDITGTLMNSGYARSAEREADDSAVVIMERVGYNPNGLVDMLGQMKHNLKPGGADFAKTHPDPMDRIKDVKGAIGSYQAAAAPEARQVRFNEAMRGL